MAQEHRPGSRSVSVRRRSPMGWLPWLALALLALIALLVFLIVRNVADDDDRSGVDVNDDERGAAVYVGWKAP